jgi:hypothetical protein
MPSGLADLADNDPKIDAAYDHGQGGGDFDEFAKEHKLSASSTRSTVSSAAGSASHTGGSILLGLLAVAMVLSVVDYGPTGPLLWFKAKFLNMPAPKPGAPQSVASNVTPITKKKVG